jgi:hypothetical protein
MGLRGRERTYARSVNLGDTPKRDWDRIEWNGITGVNLSTLEMFVSCVA